MNLPYAEVEFDKKGAAVRAQEVTDPVPSSPTRTRRMSSS